jgi:hypothetical protein
MPNLNPNQRIYDVFKDIERGVYRLPNIQRGFEWEEDRICKLLGLKIWRPTFPATPLASAAQKPGAPSMRTEI